MPLTDREEISELKSEIAGYHLAMFIGGLVAFMVCLGSGMNSVFRNAEIKQLKQEAVIRGYAEYHSETAKKIKGGLVPADTIIHDIEWRWKLDYEQLNPGGK